jgi:hypothetical protein
MKGVSNSDAAKNRKRPRTERLFLEEVLVPIGARWWILA